MVKLKVKGYVSNNKKAIPMKKVDIKMLLFVLDLYKEIGKLDIFINTYQKQIDIDS